MLKFCHDLKSDLVVIDICTHSTSRYDFTLLGSRGQQLPIILYKIVQSLNFRKYCNIVNKRL